MTTNKLYIELLCAALASSLPLLVAAQTNTPPSQSSQAGPADSQQGESGKRHHRPPPEALAACEGKSSGSACSFTGKEGESLTGTCFSPPQQESSNQGVQESHPLACKPTHKPSSGGGSNQSF